MNFLMSLLPELSFGKVALGIGAIMLVVGLFIGIKHLGIQQATIDQLEADLVATKKANETYITELNHQHELSLRILTKEKDDAIQLTASAQSQLDKIARTDKAGDGPTRPVVTDTFGWMRRSK